MAVLVDGFDESHTGGIVNSLRVEIECLHNRGHDLVVVARRLERTEEARVVWHDIPIHRYPAPARSTFFYPSVPAFSLTMQPAKLRRLQRRERFDVAYAHSSLATLGAKLAVVGGRHMPTIYCYHAPIASEIAEDRRGGRYGRRGWMYSMTEPAARWVEGWALARADTVMTRSGAMRTELLRGHRRFQRPVEVVPLSVDLSRFPAEASREEARRRLNVTGPLIVCVRRLVARMGIDMLLEAFAVVRSRHPGAQLAIAGKGYMASSLEDLARRLGIAPAVRFLGFVADGDLPDWYRAADVVALPSRALEGFGLVTLEALACGAPVVATPVGASPEVLGPLGDGHVSQDTSPAAFAKALDGWLSHPPTQEQRRRFTQYVEHAFAPDVVAAQLEKVFLRAVNQP